MKAQGVWWKNGGQGRSGEPSSWVGWAEEAAGAIVDGRHYSVTWTNNCLVQVCKRQNPENAGTVPWVSSDSHEPLCVHGSQCHVHLLWWVWWSKWPIQALVVNFKMLGCLSHKFLQGSVYLSLGMGWFWPQLLCRCQSMDCCLHGHQGWLAFEPPKRFKLTVILDTTEVRNQLLVPHMSPICTLFKSHGFKV